MERNVASLDTVGLGLVERGVAKLDAKDARGGGRSLPDRGRARARAARRRTRGSRVALLKKGPLGVVPSIDAAVSGLSAFLPTGRGHRSARDLATVAALLAAFAVAWAVAVALARAARRPAAPRPRGVAGPRPGPLRLAGALPAAAPPAGGDLPGVGLAAPVVARARSSPTSTRAERALVGLLLAAALAVGPAVASLELRLRTARNPLFHAALAAVESAPDRAAIARLEEAARSDPEDRDLAYLLGAAPQARGPLRGGGGAVPAGCSRPIPADAVARNNLANIEFVRGSYDAARARYRAGTEAGAPPEVAATSYYNLSLAHLQKFEYQAYNEAKSNADRLAPGLVADYDRWKYDSGDYAVVDLGLTREQVRDKFAGSESGVAVRNVAARGAAAVAAGDPRSAPCANRFAASRRGLRARRVPRRALARAEGVHAPLRPVRDGLLPLLPPGAGERRASARSATTCSWCGTGSPARRATARWPRCSERTGAAERVFRVLSVLSPGAGQVYGGWTLRGAALLAGLVRGAGAARGPMGGALHGSAGAPRRRRGRRWRPGWCSSGSGWPRTGSAPSPTSSCRPARPARGGPGPRRRRDRRWPSKGRSATSACRTSSSSSGCSGRPAS